METMVEQTDTGWLTVFEKRGILQETLFLQQYGIGSDTEVSELEPDDFSEMETRGQSLLLDEAQTLV